MIEPNAIHTCRRGEFVKEVWNEQRSNLRHHFYCYSWRVTA